MTLRLSAAVLAMAAIAAGPAEAGLLAELQPQRDSRTTTRARDREPGMAEALRARIESVFTVLGDGLDFDRAADELQTIFDQAIAYARSDASLIRDAAFALRLVEHLRQADESLHRQLFDLLRENEELARTLVFLVSEDDNIPQVYSILARLHRASARNLERYPALAAAICVVYDRPRYARSTPPEARRQIDPVAVFGYFVNNAGQMLYSPRTTAPELLVYMVETTADIDELHWAFSRHRGDRMVHKRFNDINYDTASFRYNRPKRISEHPYTLENIRRYGGVCEEQAYYAAHAGRAIGVPAVVISGRSATGAHCWVGVVQTRGGGPVWYMEEGRYDDYRDLRGTVTHPQTNRRIPDDQVALSARVARIPMPERHAATAYIDAANRIWSLSSGDPWPPEPPHDDAGEPAEADSALGIALLQRAANAAPTMPEVWNTLQRAAAAGHLSASDRVRWFDAIFTAIGNHHPYFTFNILAAMIASVENPAEQAEAWEWVSRRYRQRPDLAAESLLMRGRAFQEAGDRHQAYLSFMEVVNRYGNDGTAAVLALRAGEQLLREGGRQEHTLEMYRQAFQRMRRPSMTSANFFRQSNFYRIGDRYATLLEAAGRDADARRIRRQIAAGDRDRD